MECDRTHCKRTQRKLHQQASTPVAYYCCLCNGCERVPCDDARSNP